MDTKTIVCFLMAALAIVAAWAAPVLIRFRIRVYEALRFTFLARTWKSRIPWWVTVMRTSCLAVTAVVVVLAFVF
jgi:hypothetical protein